MRTNNIPSLSNFGLFECNRLNPVALREAKIAYNFGLSECNIGLKSNLKNQP